MLDGFFSGVNLPTTNPMRPSAGQSSGDSENPIENRGSIPFSTLMTREEGIGKCFSSCRLINSALVTIQAERRHSILSVNRCHEL